MPASHSLRIVLSRRPTATQGAETVTQLSKEVELMATLKHPNIVPIYASEVKNVGRDAVEINVIMEYCVGGHLLAKVNGLAESKRLLPWTKTLEVFLSIVRPVAYLHERSPPVCHRDLKFENVLVAADGSLRLCDFGSADSHQGPIADAADRADQEDKITRFTTPHFRSPEMVDLYSGLVLDERSDVWVRGVGADAASAVSRMILLPPPCRRPWAA